MSRLLRVLLAGAVLLVPVASRAAEPPAGTYKLILPLTGGMWLVKFDSKGDKWTGTILDGPKDAPKSTVEAVTVDKDFLRFTFNIGNIAAEFEGRLAKEKIFGSISERGSVAPVILEPTTLTSLDPFEQAREFLAKNDSGYEVVRAAFDCLQKAADKKIKTAEVKTWVEKAAKAAEAFGPTLSRITLLELVESLNEQEGYEALAVEYAQKVKDLLTEKDRSTFKKRVLLAQADALERNGKKTEAKAARDAAGALPYIDVTKFAGRKSKNDRVVLVELFTGAECLPCIAADKAFDALLETYKPSEAVFLEYHLHIPGPDPLTSPDSERREKFYRRQVRGTPTILFNGGVFPQAGGKSLAEAQNRYEEFSAVINSWLEKPNPTRLTATASRKGNMIDIKVDVESLPEFGTDVKLRVALVEETVTYTGSNKLPVHHQVVRAFVGDGADGTPMKTKTATKSITVDVADLRSKLEMYLKKQNEMAQFPHPGRPLDLKKLRVIAFVQNDDGNEVYNAVQVEVKE